MQLNERTLRHLAVMICGNKEEALGKHFPYRTSSALTNFFLDCELDYIHDGSTRKYWVIDVLKELNLEISPLPDLPSESILCILATLLEQDNFQDTDLDREKALFDLNKVLERESLAAFADVSGKCLVRSLGTGMTSTMLPKRPHALTREECIQRDRLSQFLDSASEDEFTEVVLVPFFQRLGFHRVDALGHREKLLEFGKDLWMKYQLPTGHWLYFCAQIKKNKIDAKGSSSGNVSEVLNQARMAFDHEIFDPDYNQKVLLDHLILISASTITRAARQWLACHLDKEQRRTIIFMERKELLDHAARIVSELPLTSTIKNSDDNVPF